MKILAEYTETTPNFTQQWNLVEVMGDEFFTCCLKWNGDNGELIVRRKWELEVYFPLVLEKLMEIQASKSEGFWTTEEERKWGYLYENPLIKTQEVEWREGMGT